MKPTPLPDDALILGSIQITRYMSDTEGVTSGLAVSVEGTNGEPSFSLIESMGMLEVAKDTLYRVYDDADEEGEEE